MMRPFMALTYAIIEQAVQDIRALQQAKLIVDGKINMQATRFNSGRHSVGYRKNSEVRELLEFFHDDNLNPLLAAVGSELTAATIRRRIGL
jgi:hypothetical protein